MTNRKPLTYHVDIVMCIDKTGSMSRLIDEVKSKAISFCQMFVDAMEEADKAVEQLRIKVIAFGDYDYDERPMAISGFFTLPDQNEEFEKFVNSISAEGGGDEYENALEALAHAIKSDWNTQGRLKRHIILLFTDTSALELGQRIDFSKDDEQIIMPSDLDELGDWWEAMDKRSKRMCIFAPNAYPWDDFSTSWNNFIHMPSIAGSGCENIEIMDIIILDHLLVVVIK